MRIRNKVITLFTMLAAAITLLLGIFIYLFTEQYLDENFFQRMDTRAGIAAQIKFNGSDQSSTDFYNALRNKHLQRLSKEKEYVFALPLSRDTALANGIVLPPNYQVKLVQTKELKFKNQQTSFVAIPYDHENKSYVVILSAVNTEGKEMLHILKKNLLIGLIIAVVLAYFISLVLSKELVNPIRRIIKDTKKITASNLHLRLETKGKDEIADLTQTFNDMLDRLETSFETQSNFLSKAAHELRTPLTAIIGEAELALSKQRSPEEYEAALQIITRESEQLHHHTSSLLELAQAGYNSKEPFMSEVRLDELLFTVKKALDFTEPGNKVQIDLRKLPDNEKQLTVVGNANLLKLALANIIQNGCKYSNNNPVYVSIEADGINSIITIQDFGIGIPEKEMRYIFDPFFRASNTTPYKGYGFGLPLAQKIIRLHRGQLLHFSKENEGTTVKILLQHLLH